MPTRIKTVTAFSESTNDDHCFGIDVGFNDTLRRVSLAYDGDDEAINFPYCGIDVVIEALQRIKAEYA